MADNFLELKQDKTEVLFIGLEDKSEIILPDLQNLKPYCVINLGIIFDFELNLQI